MASWQSAMKVDPVAFTSAGVYSEVYGVGEEGNVANLFASIGLVEDAPDAAPSAVKMALVLLRSRIRRA
jgi:hypothetical protein